MGLGYRISQIVLDEKALQEGVGRLAAAIDRDFEGRSVLLVGVLKGAVLFLADLSRRIRAPLTLDFIQVSSYGSAMRAAGAPVFVRDLSTDVAGRDVIVVEDVVDTGETLRSIRDALEKRGPRSLRVCALLRKKTAGASRVPLDYVGFEIDDRFVVGYGLDCAEAYRNLPYLAVLEATKGEP
jgi:hypoxanthine phosphoribosyltransferase